MMLLYVDLLLILINLALIGAVYKGQRSYSSKAGALEVTFSYFVGSISAWIAIQTSYDYLNKPDQLHLLQYALDSGLVFSILVAMSFWRFISEFARERIGKTKLYLHITGGIIVSLAGLLLKPVSAILVKGEISYQYKSLLYGAFTAYLLAYFISGLWILLVRSKKSSKPEKYSMNKKRLTAGMAIALISILISNLFIPALGINPDLATQLSNVFLVLGTTLLSFSAAFSAFNLGAFDFRRFILRAVLVVMSYLIPIVGFLYLISLAFTDIVGSSSITLNSSGGRLFYILSVIIGILTAYITKQYLVDSVSRIFSKNSFSDQEFAAAIENLIKTEFSDNLTSKFAVLCKQFLSVDKVIIFVGGKSNSDMSNLNSMGSSAQVLDRDAEITKLCGEIESRGKKNGSKSRDFMEDIQLSTDSEVNYLLQYDQSQLHGAVFLGSKLNGRRYYADEVIALRKALVEVLLAMQNIFRLRQLVEFNQSLEDKIELATKELRHTNDKLKALDEAKDEFISMASHQLRTPLTSIKGYISLILDGDMGKVPSKQRKMLSEAFSSSQRMVYLISDLLNVSRLKNGKFIIEAVDVYLPDVIEEEIDLVKEMAEAKGIKINYHKPKRFNHIELDDIKIRQVIMNFIDNAIHYTPEGGEISIVLEENSKSVSFKVIDSGIGVPRSEQYNLFTKFYRAGNARKTRPDGTGLGLFMGKKVIVASGGSIVFNSTEGKGSTFGFNFPKKSTFGHIENTTSPY